MGRRSGCYVKNTFTSTSKPGLYGVAPSEPPASEAGPISYANRRHAETNHKHEVVR